MVSPTEYTKKQEPYVEFLARKWREGAFGSSEGGVTTEPIDPAALLVGPGGQLASGAIGATSGAVDIGGAGISKGISGATSGTIAGFSTKTVLSKVGFWKALGMLGVVGIAVNKIGGREINKLFSDLGIPAGQLDVSSREFLYTNPIEDPKTGELVFIDPDGKLVREGMRAAGIPKEDIELRMQALTAQKADNEAVKEYYNTQILGTEFKRVGETPKKAVLRSERLQDVKEEQLIREQISGEKRASEQQAESAQQRQILGEKFTRETGLTPTEEKLRPEAFQGNVTAEELLALLRTQPPQPGESGGELSEEQKILAKKKEGERITAATEGRKLPVAGKDFSPLSLMRQGTQQAI